MCLATLITGSYLGVVSLPSVRVDPFQGASGTAASAGTGRYRQWSRSRS